MTRCRTKITDIEWYDEQFDHYTKSEYFLSICSSGFTLEANTQNTHMDNGLFTAPGCHKHDIG